MGVYTPAQFAAKLGEVAVAVGTVGVVKSVGDSSLLIKSTILAKSGRRLRGVGKRGAAIGVTYAVTETGSGAESLIRATGPFQLIERDTAAHEIVPKSRQALHFGGDQFYAAVQSPGTKGKHPFELGVVEAWPGVTKIMQSHVAADIAAVL